MQSRLLWTAGNVRLRPEGLPVHPAQGPLESASQLGWHLETGCGVEVGKEGREGSGGLYFSVELIVIPTATLTVFLGRSNNSS